MRNLLWFLWPLLVVSSYAIFAHNKAKEEREAKLAECYKEFGQLLDVNFCEMDRTVLHNRDKHYIAVKKSCGEIPNNITEDKLKKLGDCFFTKWGQYVLVSKDGPVYYLTEEDSHHNDDDGGMFFIIMQQMLMNTQ